MDKLSKNTVLITGVNKGLGKELFNLFISKNYLVIGLLRNKEAYRSLETSLPLNAKLILADLSSDDSINIIKENLVDQPIDLLINNAGIGGYQRNLDEVESEEILSLINIHCLGVLRTMKALKENLTASKNGIVVNLNSRLGSINRQSNGAYKNLSVSYSYRIAKASQNMLTNCLKREFEGQIKFISLHPGKMKTEIAQTDANLFPADVAKSILQAYEGDMFVEQNGILELPNSVIEW